MLDESAVKAGQAVCSLYWDIEKFYDSVAYDVVIRRCLERQYHPVLLQLTIRACLGPRLPRQGLHHGSWQWASNSILAGSGQANNLARCMVYAVIEQAHDDYMPRCPISFCVFVDDVKQRAEGPVDQLIPALTHGAVRFAQLVQASRLQLSAKSAAVSHPAWIAGQVCEKLEREG
eukprot:6663696-Lingulodinium_polyedra.AAC.1